MTDIEADIVIFKARIKQLEAERDAAVTDMTAAQTCVCNICKKLKVCDWIVKGDVLICGEFEWRGPQEAEKGEA